MPEPRDRIVDPRDEVEGLDRLGGRLRRAGDSAAAERAYRRALAIAELQLPHGDL